MKEFSIFFQYKNSKIHLLRFGEGKELLIAFHGYGDDAALYAPLAGVLGKRYTIYSIDLPFHGKTDWGDADYSKEDVMQWIQWIMKEEGSTSLALMGYSYGGRIVQKMVPDFIHQISCIYLLAPDGIFTRGLVNAHLVPRFFRVFLRRSLRNPDWLLSMVRLFHRWRLLNSFNLKFLTYHLSHEVRRNRLFNAWISMSEFRLYPSKTKRWFRKSGLPVQLYFGKRDPVIPVKAGEWMARDLPNVDLFLLEENHRLIGDHLIALLDKQIKKS